MTTAPRPFRFKRFWIKTSPPQRIRSITAADQLEHPPYDVKPKLHVEDLLSSLAFYASSW